MRGVWRPLLWLALVLILLHLSSCGDLGDEPLAPGADDQPAPLPDTVSYAAHIQPLFDANCVVCHGAVANAGLDLRAPQSWGNLVGAASTESPLLRVAPGQPDQSWLYRKLIGTQDFGTEMPPGAPLGTDRTDLVRIWIEDGAHDD